jgi:hypothetical protein
MASIGSILTSVLPPVSPDQVLASCFSSPPHFALRGFMTQRAVSPDPLTLRNVQVTILAVSSTLARIATGFLADYLAPPLVAVPIRADVVSGTPSETGTGDDADEMPKVKYVRLHPVRMWRMTFAGICAAVLGGVFVLGASIVKDEKTVWILSVGVGAMYGSLFTLTVSIVFVFLSKSHKVSAHTAACCRIGAFRTAQLRLCVGHDFVLCRPGLGGLFGESFGVGGLVLFICRERGVLTDSSSMPGSANWPPPPRLLISPLPPPPSATARRVSRRSSGSARPVVSWRL